MAEESAHPLRLVNFVSEEQLDQAKKTRGECADDGTAQRDKPLFESRRENERQLAEEEAQQLRSFQAAVAAHSSIIHELKETPSVPKVEDQKPLGKQNPRNRPLGGLIITVKPQAKKAKTDAASSEKPPDKVNGTNCNIDKSPDIAENSLGGLVSYSDESDDDS
ncbi:uncharacterized protein LOC122670341 isoform X3 [Telopea speciosissima]|uniref:uncharacterized protein LOC122670341 isoform X3 n=1 Tax=Telopea speciosissima TaxID=54955 RepID=UPI001CC6F516|nr:uncharacterized protein LOC122670341 isoform X3 [Telopea speciosissima]